MNPTTTAGGSSGKLRILLAEDNADVARIVSFYLRNMRNAEVMVCRDGSEAIAAMTHSR